MMMIKAMVIMMIMMFNWQHNVSKLTQLPQFIFLDALASLDFKLSVSESFTFFIASASTGLSELFLLFADLGLVKAFKICFSDIYAVLPYSLFKTLNQDFFR